MAKVENRFETGQYVIFHKVGISDKHELLKPDETICFILDSEKDTSYSIPKFIYQIQFKKPSGGTIEWWVFEESLIEMSSEFAALKTDEERHKYFICKKIKDMYKRRKDQGYAF